MAEDIFSDYPESGSQGEKEYHSRDDVSIFQTEKNPRSEYVPPAPDVDYGVGADGYVTPPAKSSGGGGSAAPFIHPFKIESVTDPDTNVTKTRVYKGNLFARIDTFLLAQRTITTTTATYDTSDPPAGPYTTEEDLGTFTITGLTATLPQHTHESRNSGEDGLLMPNHEHNAGTGTDNLKIPQHAHEIGISGNTDSVVNSGGSNTCQDGGHYHQIYINQQTSNIVSGTNLSVSGKTEEVKDYDTVDSGTGLKKKHVTGSTGNVSGTLPAVPITVSSSSSSLELEHKHRVPAISNPATHHKFIEIAGQSFPANNDIATDWGATFNKTVTEDDGTSTIFEYHESSSSTGIFYVKWVITINESANVSSIVGSIHRTELGGDVPTNTDFGVLSPPEVGKLTRAEEGRTGTFYQKIGEAHSTYVKQDQFSNINWSMTVLPEVNPNP